MAVAAVVVKVDETAAAIMDTAPGKSVVGSPTDAAESDNTVRDCPSCVACMRSGKETAGKLSARKAAGIEGNSTGSVRGADRGCGASAALIVASS